MTPDRADDLALLEAAAAEAGALALSWFGREQQTWVKGETSIVGEADFAVDRRLTEILRAARPDYGWLSEETEDDPARLDRERVFVVDPIDGTRAFIAGRKEWTVSLAIVEDGRPVVGVLVAPALGETFSAVAGHGATLNGQRISVSGETHMNRLRFAASRRYARAVAGPSQAVRYVPSLAYRIALVAAGTVEVAVAGPNARDWDLAAADLIVREAGGHVADLSGGIIRYNQADSAHPALVATTPALFEAVSGLLRSVRDGA